LKIAPNGSPASDENAIQKRDEHPVIETLQPDGQSQISDALVSEIHRRSELILPDIIELRRHLHRHPELAEQEFGTTAYLARLVESIGLQPNICPSRTGLTCDLLHTGGTGQAQDRIVIRGDIDALPICDTKSVDYRSTRDGLMHACGHDAHAAIVYGTLRLLVSLQNDGLLPWPIAVRGLFQPAEETATGAASMIRDHALRNVSAAIALHVDPNRAVGQVGLRNGTLTASCDTFRVEFEGQGGHGSRPHLTKDPIEAAAAWITTAYRRVPRTIDAQNPVVISVGIIHAGQASNVIPNTATLEGTLRTLDRPSRRNALEAMEDVNLAISHEFGVTVQTKLLQSAPPVENNPALTKMMGSVAERIICPGCVEWIPRPSMGSEDFSYYLDHVPGTMFRLGVAGKQVGQAALHTPMFDIDERALAVGMRLFSATAIEYFCPAHDRK
jgi:amidohydrolase